MYELNKCEKMIGDKPQHRKLYFSSTSTACSRQTEVSNCSLDVLYQRIDGSGSDELALPLATTTGPATEQGRAAKRVQLDLPREDSHLGKLAG